MKDCDKYMQMMSQYIDGMLDDRKLSELEAHMDDCDDCRNEFHAIKSLVSELNQLDEMPLPENFHEKAMMRIAGEEKAAAALKKKTRFSMSRINPASFVPVAASVLACFIVLGSALSLLNGNMLYQLNSNTDMAPRAASVAERAVDEDVEESILEGAEPESGPAESYSMPYMAADAPDAAQSERNKQAGMADSAAPLMGEQPTAAVSAAGAPMAEAPMVEAPMVEAPMVEAPMEESLPADMPMTIQSMDAQAAPERATADTRMSTADTFDASGPLTASADSGGQNSATAGSAYPEMPGYSAATGAYYEELNTFLTDIVAKEYRIQIKVANLDEAAAVMRSSGWDIESSGVSGEKALFHLNIPAWQAEDELAYIKTLGEVKSENQHSMNLTDETIEAAISYNAKGQEIQRLTELIKISETADDMIALESRIATLEQEKAELRSLYQANINRSEQSVVSVELFTQGGSAVPAESFSSQAGHAFVSSVNMTASLFEKIMVLLSYLLLPVVIVVVVFVILRQLWKRIRRGRQ